MNTKELGVAVGRAAAVLMLAATGLANAGAPAGASDKLRAEPASVLTQALNDIRAEQRQAVQQAALRALAGLRSETLAALSNGGTVSASTSVQTKP